MSIFKENTWDTDETGDKLTKELFLGRKKPAKPVKNNSENVSKGGNKKFAENGKRKSRVQKKATVRDSNVTPANPDKINNKKRKSSPVITIDKSMIKKWKSESMGRPQARRDAAEPKNTVKTNPDRKTTGAVEAAAPKATSDKKKKRSESIDKPEKPSNRKKKLKSAPENDPETGNVMTKSQKRRLKLKEKQKNLASNGAMTIENGSNGAEESSNTLGKSGLKMDRLQKLLEEKQQRGTQSKKSNVEPTTLRDRMLSRLKSSRFRYLNEQMYNSESWSSKKYFKEDPDAFAAYHEGYKLQVEQWPLNPLDTIISSIKKLPKDYVVADFGCGEARLAESVTQKVHSLDLVAVNEKVTACDMAHTSLLTGRIDVVVFCLSLMGTNLADYLIEANRVLRKDGILKIAEVESRFEDVDEFVKSLSSYGFVNTWKDFNHNLFYFMDFKKEGEITKKRNKLLPVTLKSCLYKRR